MEEVSRRTFPSPAFRDALKRTVDEQVRTATIARLFPTDNLGMKCIRPQEMSVNVQEFKRMLREKDEELAGKNNQLAELKLKLKLAKKHANSTPIVDETSTPLTGANNSKPLSEKQLATKVSQLRRSIRSQVVIQMVYKHSSTGGTKLAPVEICDVLEYTITSLVGNALYAEASSGPKQLKLVLSNEVVDAIFEGRVSKTL